MAKSGSGSSKQRKRLAGAKVSAASASADKKAGRSSAPKAKTSAQLKTDRRNRITAIVIVVFAVVMAVSMMLPSLSAIFARGGNSASNSETTSGSSDSGDSSNLSDSSSGTDSSTNGNLEKVDNNYGSTVSALEARLSGDPQNLATLLNLGNDYMSWAYSARSYASTDDEKTHVSDLWSKAINYFDQYLSLNDSNAVKVNRALCQYYSGDVSAATAALEQLTVDAPDYGPAWANLGLMYESAGNSTKATTAYEKAKQADPDDEYGSKSFAEERLAAMSASSSSTTSSTSGGTTSAGTTSTTQGLSDVLAGASGTTL